MRRNPRKVLLLAMRMSGIAIISSTSVWAQATQRVSVATGGAQGNHGSGSASMTPDGRYVAFSSSATNLVAGDTNGSLDAFVHDLQTGATTRVSVDSIGAESNAPSFDPSISADGRYVAFVSLASNLVPGDTNGFNDTFVHDRQSGATVRVSVDSGGGQGNESSYGPSISADGRCVAFSSGGSNLVPGDTNGVSDAFVHDLLSGATVRVSVDSSGGQGNGSSFSGSISADGRSVSFESHARNLVLGDSNGVEDVFAHDLQSGATVRVSVSSGGGQGHDESMNSSISADGRLVAFQSLATDLVPGDTNGKNDIFVHDLQSGATARASVSSGGGQGNDYSFDSSISADGRFVAFDSLSSNLVSGDSNNTWDIFVHDLLTGTTTRVNLDSGGMQGNLGGSYDPSISADGRHVAFESDAANFVLGDTNDVSDVFVRDRGAASAFTAFCFGDGSGAVCPCGNNGGAGRGCENSSGTGGALMTASGVASLSGDTVQLTSSGERPTALSIVLQGSTAIAPVNFGDGLRCAGGDLKRLRVENAVGGMVVYPDGAETPIAARSAALGDPIALGESRYYQVHYRDPSATFCADPPGGTFNVSNAIAVAWGG